MVLCGGECRTRAECCEYHNLYTCSDDNPNKSEVHIVKDEELSPDDEYANIICYDYCCDADSEAYCYGDCQTIQTISAMGGGHIRFVGDGSATEHTNEDGQEVYVVHVEYDVEGNPTVVRNYCCATDDCCSEAPFNYGGYWNTHHDECCVEGEYVDDNGQVIKIGPYTWTQSYYYRDTDGSVKHRVETGSTLVVDGCCENPNEHWCPDGCRPITNEGDNLFCCETNTYWCYKDGTCHASEIPGYDCCNTKVCPAKYGGVEYCLEDAPNYDEGEDCCSVTDTDLRECATAHPHVNFDNIYTPEVFAVLTNLEDMGNCRRVGECCNEPEEYYCQKLQTCLALDQPCCIDFCEEPFIYVEGAIVLGADKIIFNDVRVVDEAFCTDDSSDLCCEEFTPECP